MKLLRTNCLNLALLIFISPWILLAQPPNSSERQANPSIKDLPRASFISEAGKFSIQLAQPDGKLVWKFKEGEIRLGFFDVGYYVNFPNAKDFEYFVWLFETRTLDKIPGKSDQTRSTIDGETGKASVFYNFDDGSFGIQKTYRIEKRFYIMLAVFEDQKNTPFFERVFETFKAAGKVDFETIFNQIIKEITPDPLPQTPVAAGEKPDRTDENLKGRVRKIVEESHGSQDLKSKQRIIGKIFEYDRRGYLLKETSSNYGNPSSVTIYGFVNGRRTSRQGFIIEKFSLFDPVPDVFSFKNVKGNVAADYIYTSAYVKKYKNGKLSERIYYDHSGRIVYRHTYRYIENQVETVGAYADGKQAMKTLSTFNKNGDIVEEIYYNAEVMGGFTRQAFEYEYDKTGNWIKKTVFLDRRDYPENRLVPQYSIFRKITYFK